MAVPELLTKGLRLEDLARTDPRQFGIEVRRPFRFSDSQQRFWFEFLKGVALERAIASSQEDDQQVRDRNLSLAAKIVSTETGESDSSKLQLIRASAIVRNLAWYEGSHLTEVVGIAEKLMTPDKPLLAREDASGALKNAAYYPGEHISQVAELVSGNWPRSSVRIRNECTRAVLYASRHSAHLLQTDRIKAFLVARTGDRNAVIAQNAKKAQKRLGF